MNHDGYDLQLTYFYEVHMCGIIVILDFILHLLIIEFIVIMDVNDFFYIFFLYLVNRSNFNFLSYFVCFPL